MDVTTTGVPRTALVRGHGHPNLRATHDATLELTAEPVVTERATCVVAVAAQIDADTLGLLRGRVGLTLTVDGRTVTGEAVVNPDHEVRDRLVVRRSRHRDPVTLATDATVTAAALRSPVCAGLAAQLTDPTTTVTLEIHELSAPPPLVIAADGEPAGRLGLLWRHADGTRTRTIPRRAAAPVPPGTRVAVPGCPTTEALLAAGLPPVPTLDLGVVERRALRGDGLLRMLRTAPVPVVLSVPSTDDTERVLGAVDPERGIAVPTGPPDVGTAMTWTTAGDARAPDLSAGPLVLAAPPGAAAELLDAGWTVRALVAAGVSARTLGEALGPLGLSRRRVYQLLDQGRDDSSTGEGTGGRSGETTGGRGGGITDEGGDETTGAGGGTTDEGGDGGTDTGRPLAPRT